jgi:CheY-like chemotaxis protein
VCGKIVLQLAPVTLGEILHAAIEASMPGIEQRRQHLKVDSADEAVVIDGDLVRLAQVFSNLLNNASQFSDIEGVIAVSTVCRNAMVEVTVSDNGAGIAPELQPHVFDLFTQGARTLERAAGGLGIGLSLVKTIVAMHGGATALYSAGAGAGSTFTISLPLGVVLVRPPALTAARLDGSFDVLIIEDNVDANEIMGMLLELEGHRVTNSFDGAEGLRVALGRRFDIVVCDLGLPGLTGLEVVAAIKAHHGQDAPLMIATTGYSEDAKRDLARAAGFDHYLVKPVNVSSVLAAIAERNQ